MFHLRRPDDGIGGTDGQTQRTPDTILPPNKSHFNNSLSRPRASAGEGGIRIISLSRVRGRVGVGGSVSGRQGGGGSAIFPDNPGNSPQCIFPSGRAKPNGNFPARDGAGVGFAPRIPAIPALQLRQFGVNGIGESFITAIPPPRGGKGKPSQRPSRDQRRPPESQNNRKHSAIIISVRCGRRKFYAILPQTQKETEMDTLAITEELVAAGVPEPQAKAIAKTQVASSRAAARESSEKLATQADIARLEKMMSEMEMRMMRFSIFLALGTLTLQTGLIAILLMLFLDR